MVRRWVIRGVAIALLMLCVGAWGVSYWRQIGIVHQSTTAKNELGVNRGRFFLSGSRPFGPTWSVINDGTEDWGRFDAIAAFKFLGFTFTRSAFAWLLTIPLWFPTLASAALLFVIWRKTRRKHGGKGFPVDATAKQDA